MLRVHSLKAKLLISGILMAAVPMAILLGMTIKFQADVTELAVEECSQLGFGSLDHITMGVYHACQAQQAVSGTVGEVDPHTVASQELREAIMSIRVGEKGYVYVLDNEGRYVVSAGGKRDGANLWNVRDADGLLVIQEIIRKARQTPGQPVEQFYSWSDDKHSKPRTKVARVVHYPEWGWTIGTGAYMEDFLAAHDHIKDASRANIRNFTIVAILALLTIAGSVWFAVKSITVPLKKAVDVAGHVSRGNLDHQLEVSGKDEVAILSRALNDMTAGLRQKVKVLEKVADGDLTEEVNPHGEDDVFSQALKKMSDSLQSTIHGILEISNQVRAGSREVYDSSLSLSQGAVEQAASLQEITANMTELSNRLKGNAEGAATADRLSSETLESAQQGVGKMQDLSTAMVEIAASSEEIAKIIKVIDDIAFQTNLLALNAAVEAARAGKHGKGFAVVAEEVRNLAGRSAKAARETAELIEGSLEKVERGSSLAAVTSQSLENIVQSATQTSNLVEEIAQANSQQTQAIEEVTLGLGQIDAVTQKNSANSRETASAGQELSGQAEVLQGLVSSFRTREEEVASVPEASAPTREEPVLQEDVWEDVPV
ncbi:chemotaxis protein [bacterium DOLJORAL78_65_58]|nr:MAG: chemotaxis protein [bacterium DOLZORAL124_64_63]PIE76495.1 MAG: chemotaxis protein [bacterium DOLJORAL78_65_58]